MNPGFLVAIALSVFSFFTLIFWGVEIAVTIYTILYPGFLSVQAIETKETAEDDKHWLTYWMFYGFLDVAETFFGFVFYFIPYWSYLRIILFVWIISFGGASTLFGMIKPLVSKHKDTV